MQKFMGVNYPTTLFKKSIDFAIQETAIKQWNFQIEEQ